MTVRARGVVAFALASLAVDACAGAKSAPSLGASMDGGGANDAGAVDGSSYGLDATAHDGSTGTDATSSDGTSSGSDASDASDAGLTRDPLQQPFATTSIWNMPIGTGAVYVDAGIAPITGTTLEADEDVIVLTPSAPTLDILYSPAAWNSSESRCTTDGGVLLSAPIPANFVVPDPVSDTPNAALAVLSADGRTLLQTQPFARCTAGSPGTSYVTFANEDLYGPGTAGAHGGSGLSAIGGTLRLGELRPDGGPPAHALKLELFAHDDYYNDGNSADCYRWPATTCDDYFDDSSSSLEYGGTNSALKPGALLALSTSVTIASLGLTTEPAKQLAWTLQNYGGYLVDDTAWSALAICTEEGPNGNFTDQFASDWGFAFNTSGTSGAFASDVAKIVAALSVVENNSAASVGGGGTPLQPLAPEIGP